MTPFVLSYRITLRAAALFPVGTGDPNAPDTAHYIPGSAVLGALASRWLVKQRAGDAASDPVFRRLFLDGTTCFLHAYPATAEGERMLPAPRSLFESKNPAGRGRLTDAVLAEPDEDHRPAWLRLGFVRWKANVLSYRIPRVEADLHHVRDRDLGRPAEGGLFFYQAIVAGETFAGAILASSDEDRSSLEKLMIGSELRLGRSRHVQYGAAAEVEILPTFVEAARTWEDEPPEELVVTLLSDYVGRSGTRGSPDPDTLVEDLRGALGGVDLVETGRSFVGYRLIHGFQANARFPRYSCPAMAAGSVLRFRPVPGVPWKQKHVQVLGLGERQAEGYGRVALDWHGSVDTNAIQAFESSRPRPAATPDSGELARVKFAMRDQWLSERLPIKAALLRKADGARAWPRPAAISALRAALARDWPRRRDKEFRKWAEEAIGEKAARQLDSFLVEIPGASGSRQSLLMLLGTLQGDEGAKWAMQALADGAAPRLVRDAAQQSPAPEVLVRSFADALLDNARREAAREAGE